MAPTVVACLAVTLVLSHRLAGEEKSTGKLVLEEAGYPSAVTTPSEYESYLDARLKELQGQVNRLTNPQTKAEACVELASFALTRGTEPALSHVWLGLRRGQDSELARRSLRQAREALTLADRVRQDQRAGGRDTHSLAGQVRRLGALAAMESVLLEQTQPAEAVQAARQADALGDCLPEAEQPTWNLLVSACLSKGGLAQDAVLRLQALLHDGQDSRTQLAAEILNCRILAGMGTHPAAVALVDEYLQSHRSQQTSEDDSQAGSPAADDGANAADTQSEGANRQPARVAVCTLTLVKANLLAEWAGQLNTAEQSSYDRQAAGTLERESARHLAQAAEAGPHLMRLLPILETLNPSTGLR